MKSNFTNYKKIAPAALALLIPTLPARAQAPDASPTATPAKTEAIIVTDHPIEGATVVVPTPELKATATDAASLLKQVPGAAVVRNGPLTGIVQLRGLSDERVRTEGSDQRGREPAGADRSAHGSPSPAKSSPRITGP